ncbi:hypothetical protein LOAG_06012 [Loa loa]|uniref:Uncharacterized protein n=1 Tax=Loa loa TaxID=7209 RepID=A0A1S0TZK4_LOALO|nr:hypothetical protein LOAG_06012 [Loa loa]EFO22477.1 hypothetical protein LOAG_06012 [Loa loa]
MATLTQSFSSILHEHGMRAASVINKEVKTTEKIICNLQKLIKSTFLKSTFPRISFHRLTSYENLIREVDDKLKYAEVYIKNRLKYVEIGRTKSIYYNTKCCRNVVRSCTCYDGKL